MASRILHVALPCGATLVVCPAPILPQWRSELARHAAPGAIKVVVYDGQPRGAGGPTSAANTGVVSASDLAAADVVGWCTLKPVLKAPGFSAWN